MKYLKSYRRVFICALGLACVVMSSCKKFVNVDAPTSQLVSETVFTSDNTVKSALAGLYGTLAINSAASLQFDLTFATGASADETTASLVTYDPFLNHAILPDNTVTTGMWTRLYVSVYQANSMIEGIENSKGGVSDAMKNQAIGEAKFIRAFCYFHLVNLWGDVPMPLTTDRSTNAALPRSPKSEVYKQMIADLTDAKAKLSSDYSYASGQRIRANSYAASALLGRVNLYAEDWSGAETSASIVINNPTLFTLLPTNGLGGLFVKNNVEAIFQLDAPQSGTSGDGNTYEGLNYLVNVATLPQYQLTKELVSSFETGDQRLVNWVGTTINQGNTYYYLYKFKNRLANKTATGEYVTYLRLGEQYLIRAEARAKQNNLSGAISDINVIRTRAGLGNTSAKTLDEILLAIERERRVELFGEYAHRWNDLRRTNRANTVLGGTANWKPTASLYPIPKDDLLNNRNLVQNPGY